jgi:hypothetical protein
MSTSLSFNNITAFRISLINLPLICLKITLTLIYLLILRWRAPIQYITQRVSFRIEKSRGHPSPFQQINQTMSPHHALGKGLRSYKNNKLKVPQNPRRSLSMSLYLPLSLMQRQKDSGVSRQQ